MFTPDEEEFLMESLPELSMEDLDAWLNTMEEQAVEEYIEVELDLISGG